MTSLETAVHSNKAVYAKDSLINKGLDLEVTRSLDDGCMSQINI